MAKLRATGILDRCRPAVSLLVLALAACATSSPAPSPSLSAASPGSERPTPALDDCSFAAGSSPHQDRELESQLLNAVDGGNVLIWSATGWCWVELIEGAEGLANLRPIASAESLQIEAMAYAISRWDRPTLAPLFVHGLRYPADQATTAFATQLFFESIGVVGNPATFNLNGLGSAMLGGKEVRVAPGTLLQPSENDRGQAYFYETGDHLFAVIANNEAWVEEVLSQLP